MRGISSWSAPEFGWWSVFKCFTQKSDDNRIFKFVGESSKKIIGKSKGSRLRSVLTSWNAGSEPTKEMGLEKPFVSWVSALEWFVKVAGKQCGEEFQSHVRLREKTAEINQPYLVVTSI